MQKASEIKPSMFSAFQMKPRIETYGDIRLLRSVNLRRGMPMGLLLSLTYSQDTTIIK